jgi:hypothetical protein
LVANGIGPSAARQAERAERDRSRETTVLADAGMPLPGTFEFVAREWLSAVHEVKVRIGHADRTRIRLEQDVFPWLGRRPVSEIDSPELLACLRRVEARGAIDTAHRVKDSCSQVFR